MEIKKGQVWKWDAKGGILFKITDIKYILGKYITTEYFSKYTDNFESFSFSERKFLNRFKYIGRFTRCGEFFFFPNNVPIESDYIISKMKSEPAPPIKSVGDPLAIQAQTSTGSASTGGKIHLRPGSGCDTHGCIRLDNNAPIKARNVEPGGKNIKFHSSITIPLKGRQSGATTLAIKDSS